MKKVFEVKYPKRSVEEPKQSNPIFNVETLTQGKIRNIEWKDGADKVYALLEKAVFILRQYVVNCPRKYSFEDIEEMARAFLKEVDYV